MSNIKKMATQQESKYGFSTVFAIILLIIGITTSNEVGKIVAYIFSGIFFLPLLVEILKMCTRRDAYYVNDMRPRKYFREINEEV